MIGRFLVPLTAIALAVGGLGAQDDKKGDKDKLQGEWTLVKLERPGEKKSGAIIKNSKLVVKGEEWLATFNGKEVKWTVKLDAAKSPKEIDFTQDGTTFRTLGIYKLDGDTLTVCRAANRAGNPSGGGERPKELKARDGVYYYVYKRAEKK
jgi:uncharacterized protein (TIGR03067 family)